MLFLLALVIYCAGQSASTREGNGGRLTACTRNHAHATEGAVPPCKKHVSRLLILIFVDVLKQFRINNNNKGAQNFVHRDDERTNVRTGNSSRLLPRLCLARAPTLPP